MNSADTPSCVSYMIVVLIVALLVSRGWGQCGGDSVPSCYPPSNSTAATSPTSNEQHALLLAKCHILCVDEVWMSFNSITLHTDKFNCYSRCECIHTYNVTQLACSETVSSQLIQIVHIETKALFHYCNMISVL